MSTMKGIWDLSKDIPTLQDAEDENVFYITKNMHLSPLCNPSLSRWIRVPNESVLQPYSNLRLSPVNRMIFHECPDCSESLKCFGALLSTGKKALFTAHCLTKKRAVFGFCSVDGWVNFGISLEPSISQLFGDTNA